MTPMRRHYDTDLSEAGGPYWRYSCLLKRPADATVKMTYQKWSTAFATCCAGTGGRHG